MSTNLEFAIKTDKVAGKIVTYVLRYFPNQQRFAVYDLMRRDNIATFDKIRINIDFAKAEKSTEHGEVGPKARGPGVLEFSKIRMPMIVGRDPDHENYGNIGFVLDVALPYPMPPIEEGLKPHLFVCALPNMRLALQHAYLKFVNNRDVGVIPVFDIGGEWNRENVPQVKIVGFTDKLELPCERIRLLKQHVDN